MMICTKVINDLYTTNQKKTMEWFTDGKSADDAARFLTIAFTSAPQVSNNDHELKSKCNE